MTGGRPRLLSVVIPAMNEEAGIGQVLEAIPRATLKEIGWDVEVVVVDGESVDRTREIAAEKAARVVVEPRRGYGRAYKTGFARARGDVIATGDADTTYPFEKLPELVATLERDNLDFLTTDRLEGLEDGSMGTKHRFGNSVLSATMRALFLVDVHDSQSGMWLFRRSALERLRLTSDGMPFSEEIKIEAFTRGLRAREVPIPYRARVGEVKLNSFRDGWRNLVFLFRKRLGIAEPES
ncbi:MAG TPA: glycosyltransferase family 2 protein [Candidatus Thermoplasmatota archaeon]|nr:glycosyltransferase family 2 protein [Candidatus Thermoplasmatota archaeon]